MNRLFLILSMTTLVTLLVHAADRTVPGVVTKVDPSAIEVRTDNNETVSVAVNASTHFRKWILAKPWAQDPRADISNVKVGTRVRIDVAPDNPNTAKTVWIVIGGVGFRS